MSAQESFNLENAKAQMKKGILEFPILLIISKGKVYSGDILKKLKGTDLIVVEGTLYPLLSRLKRMGLVEYSWQESKTGPPRKYYTLTKEGQKVLDQLQSTWTDLNKSINKLTK